MILEFESQIPNIPDYNNLIALCVDVFSKNIDRKLQNTTVSIAIVSEHTIKDLNSRYRNKDKVTDVLSFNLMSDYSTIDMTLGEIVICYSKALEQAKELNHSIDYEIATLCVHGLYHLAGYDHQTDNDYNEMKSKESYLLALIRQHYSFS
ncbi:MAG: rRNA maturation RNase YbeY [Candidatus Paceibacterota bacterium]